MRGVPGSGKSTKAKEIAEECFYAGGHPVICSADDFFVDSSTKQYNFDPKRLPAAHTYCRGKAEGAMEAEADAVIIDNTNMKRWDFSAYVSMATQYHYEVEEVVVGSFDAKSLETYAARNIHGVPKTSIQKMADRFEK